MPLEACTVSDYVVWKEGKIFKGHGVMIKREKKTGRSHSARGEERDKEWYYIGEENLFITGNKDPFSFSFNCLLFISVSDSIHHFDSRSQHPAIKISFPWSFFCNVSLIRCKDSEPKEWQLCSMYFSACEKHSRCQNTVWFPAKGSSMNLEVWDKNFRFLKESALSITLLCIYLHGSCRNKTQGLKETQNNTYTKILAPWILNIQKCMGFPMMHLQMEAHREER